MDPRNNPFSVKSSSHESRIEQKIGLDGKIKRGGEEKALNFPVVPSDMRVTIKLFEEAVKNKVSL